MRIRKLILSVLMLSLITCSAIAEGLQFLTALKDYMTQGQPAAGCRCHPRREIGIGRCSLARPRLRQRS